MSPHPLRKTLRLICLALVLACTVFGRELSGASDIRRTVNLSSSDWKLWADREAPWENDALFLPPVDLSKVPSNPPTGGWQVLTENKGFTKARVPGVAEEFLYDGFGPIKSENTDNAKGVTWWWRDITIPDFKKADRVQLCFESVRLRAEIYLDGRLVGYDMIEGTPFEVDITPHVQAGKTCQLAVRITNPGGNYTWQDYAPFKWGKHTMTMGRGFGGITGPVKLMVSDALAIEDIYIQNSPQPTSAKAFVTIRNASGSAQTRSLAIQVVEKNSPEKKLFTHSVQPATYPLGDTMIEVPIDVSNAKLWSPESPNLYLLQAALNDGNRIADLTTQPFGFRWFSVEGVGEDAMFRLNGKRVVLRSAISWGIWPVTGMVPTEELATRHITAAKEFGLNMINFHRAIGVPIVFDKADELGLMTYEEPGGMRSAGNDPFAREYARQKFLRMVKRDRSRPSLMIYNLVNEYEFHKDPSVYESEKKLMAEAHALDPSRPITLASGWADKHDVEEPVKLHMRPFDNRQYTIGWYDYHRAPGPSTFSQDDYKNPTDNGFSAVGKKEILFWGEERAVSTPPRLGLIKEALEKPGAKPGWDGAVYLDWFDRFDRFLDEKKLRSDFSTVDSLCVAMGEVGVLHQGRRIEIARMTNLTDAYVVNGWDATIQDNHSGIVDSFRFPKADPSLIARYNQPLYIAIAPRTQVVESRDAAVVDFFLINEKDINGPHTLVIGLRNASGIERIVTTTGVNAKGGDIYGQLLVPEIKIPLQAHDQGMVTVTARLLDASGKTVATGGEQVLAVNWRDDRLAGNGAVFEWGSRVRDFLREHKQLDVPAFDGTQGKLDWIVVARPPAPEPRTIPASALGEVKMSIRHGRETLERTTSSVDFSCAEGATPDPAVGATNFIVTWTGTVTAPVDGTYIIGIESIGDRRLQLNREKLFTKTTEPLQETRAYELKAGQTVPFSLELRRGTPGDVAAKLVWTTPADKSLIDPQLLFDRVSRDGTTLIIADFAETWTGLLAKNTPVKNEGRFSVGYNWTGGQFFVRDHPLFKHLPVNCALDWPYQRIMQRGGKRIGLNLQGEEFVAGAYNTWPFQLGTSVAVVPCGKGRIVLSTLDVCSHLSESDGPASVARKLLGNYIQFATVK